MSHESIPHFTVMHAANDVASHMADRVLDNVIPISRRNETAAGEQALQEERKPYSHPSEKEPGFANSAVPTLEEQTITEQWPPPSTQSDRKGPTATVNESSEGPVPNAEPSRARTPNGQLYGAPANALSSSTTNGRPSGTRHAASDTDSEERNAPAAQSIIQKHLSSKLGDNTSSLPTPMPHIDPQSFEDPISDEFWKDIWVASAVYNVNTPTIWMWIMLTQCCQTEIYRKVFHAIPDDLITTWKQYKEFVKHHERLNKPVSNELCPGSTSL
jgi:phospholipase D1/2